MRINVILPYNSPWFVLLFLLIGYFQNVQTVQSQKTHTTDYLEYKGIVVDRKSTKNLAYSNISVDDTNISSISNSDGRFLLKVPISLTNNTITISHLGYINKVIPLSQFITDGINMVKLDESIEKLPEIHVVSKDPNLIIRNFMKSRQKNYLDKPVIMKAFYRESIKKRRTYASLSEGVVEIYKRPQNGGLREMVKLNRLRKSTDYRKIDTLIIKLQGGPFNNLNLDIVKNKNMIFTDDVFDYYKFSFDRAINIDNRLTYVIDFDPNGYVSIPLFQGKLYIDAETYGLSKAFFSLNLDDQKEASKYFVRKKPRNADVIPMQANYRVDYRIKSGKWYFGYSRIDLTFKIDWNKKLFNSLYHISIEMAITDWRSTYDNENWKKDKKLKTNVILHDRSVGFSDPKFWGEYNVIEPDKSIENAIKKIQRQLNRK